LLQETKERSSLNSSWSASSSETYRPSRTPNRSKLESSGAPSIDKKGILTKKSKQVESSESSGSESEEDYGEWYFNCICGRTGRNYNDNAEMIACEKCDEWQHTKCNGLRKKASNNNIFTTFPGNPKFNILFVCAEPG